MKQVLSLQNPVGVVLIFAALLFLASSFAFGPVEDAQLADNSYGQKGQKVKVIVRVDGKEAKIDTMISLSDNKLIDEKVDSMLSKLEMDEGELVPPPPPPLPPLPPFAMHQRLGGDHFAFDSIDESILSYEKKDMGNGLEKITIIRKKHDKDHHNKESKVKEAVSDLPKK